MSEWLLLQRLIANDGAAKDLLGQSVAISGATLAVGARDADTDFVIWNNLFVFFVESCVEVVDVSNGTVGC
jgi:hypothetical protein